MPGRQLSGYVGYCETHGKRLYSDRHKAKQTIRLMGDKGMRAYACDLVPGSFHIGHLPRVVIDGGKTAREVYGSPTTEEVNR